VKGRAGYVSEKSKMIWLSHESKVLLKFIYQCFDTDSDGIICVADLNRKCIRYPEVAIFLGMNQCCDGDQELKQFLKTGQVNITYEDLCTFVSTLKRDDTPEVSLQLRRKLTYDLIGHNFFVVTLFTIASVCVKHPIFLQFLVPPENVGSVSQVIDYFNSVVCAGVCAFSHMERSFADFCCFFDHVKSWNAQSRQTSTESLFGELMMFVSTSLSDQSGDEKDVVYLPSGKALLGRDQKRILRSDLSFRADFGILIGRDSMTIFDEDGRPFTKRKLHVAADGKPALNEHNRLQKTEYEQVAQKKVTAKKVDNILAIMDAPVDIFAGKDGLPVTKGEVRDEHRMLARDLESESYVRKEVAEDNFGDLWACSEKLFSVGGQGRPSKISDCPFTRRKLHVAADSKPALKEHHRLQKVEYDKQKKVKEEFDDLLASLELESEDFVRKEVAKRNGGVDSKPALKEHHRPQKIEHKRVVQKKVTAGKMTIL